METKAIKWAKKLAEAMIEVVKTDIEDFSECSDELKEVLSMAQGIFSIKLVDIMVESADADDLENADDETKEMVQLFKTLFKA